MQDRSIHVPDSLAWFLYGGSGNALSIFIYKNAVKPKVDHGCLMMSHSFILTLYNNFHMFTSSSTDYIEHFCRLTQWQTKSILCILYCGLTYGPRALTDFPWIFAAIQMALTSKQQFDIFHSAWHKVITMNFYTIKICCCPTVDRSVDLVSHYSQW